MKRLMPSYKQLIDRFNILFRRADKEYEYERTRDPIHEAFWEGYKSALADSVGLINGIDIEEIAAKEYFV